LNSFRALVILNLLEQTQWIFSYKERTEIERMESAMGKDMEGGTEIAEICTSWQSIGP
jgi:hypothetical protein